MHILSLEINNLLSIEKAFINFENSGLVLVEGWNYDTNRANGAGKTAIFNCLSFALFEKIPRKITVSEIVRRGSKSGYAVVKLISGNNEWVVKRSRPKGVEFYRDGLKLDITQQEFESNIRFSYEQFLLTVYNPQTSSISVPRFLNSPDSEKKSFILQLLNLDKFVDLKKEADDQIKNISSLIEKDQSTINANESKIAAYSESLINESDIQDEISKLDMSITDLQKQVANFSNIPKPDFSKYKNLESNIRQKQLNISQAKTKRAMLYERYNELLASIKEFDGKTVCSECGSVLDNKDAKIKHDEHQKLIKQKLKEIKLQIDEQDSIICEEHKINNIFEKLEDKKKKDSEEYNKAIEFLNETKAILKIKLSKKESLSLQLKNNLDLKTKIANLKLINQTIYSQLQERIKELEIYKTLSSIYSPTGAQAYILDSVVDCFNEVIQKYIDLISPNMSYTLNSYKENSKGEVIAKFSETLTKNGIEVSVGSLSGGEFKGLSLCVDFALLEVLETQFGLNLNPIILDEPFDGLDVAGREIVLGLLEQLAKNRQIFVIDHASEAKSSFARTIFVALKNGVSVVST